MFFLSFQNVCWHSFLPLLSLSLTLSNSSLKRRKKVAKVFVSLLVSVSVGLMVGWLVIKDLSFRQSSTFPVLKRACFSFCFSTFCLCLQKKTLTKSFNGNYTQKHRNLHKSMICLLLCFCYFYYLSEVKGNLVLLEFLFRTTITFKHWNTFTHYCSTFTHFKWGVVEKKKNEKKKYCEQFFAYDKRTLIVCRRVIFFIFIYFFMF